MYALDYDVSPIANAVHGYCAATEVGIDAIFLAYRSFLERTQTEPIHRCVTNVHI